MLYSMPFALSPKLFYDCLTHVPYEDTRYCINQPTGNFFYDPWELKPELKGTPWEVIYNSLGVPKGEARVIKLESQESYVCHADVDDRYHLTIVGDKSYLIDLDHNDMYPSIPDGRWYEMNAGLRHTAANFGTHARYQLVIRKPLIRGTFKNQVGVKITRKPHITADEARYLFDDVLSPWLNKVNKQGFLNKFTYVDGVVTFDIEYWEYCKLKNFVPAAFDMVETDV